MTSFVQVSVDPIYFFLSLLLVTMFLIGLEFIDDEEKGTRLLGAFIWCVAYAIAIGVWLWHLHDWLNRPIYLSLYVILSLITALIMWGVSKELSTYKYKRTALILALIPTTIAIINIVVFMV